MKGFSNLNGHNLNRRIRGAALVEFTVVAFLLFMITFAIIQYSVIMNAENNLVQLARDGSRYAAVVALKIPYDGTQQQNASTQPDEVIKNYIRQEAASTSIAVADLPDSAIIITPAQNISGGRASNTANGIKVEIDYDMTKKVYVASLVPGAGNFKQLIKRSATMYVEPQN